MACMYLLGHPDVYRSHDFATIYWYQYVKFVKETWNIHTMKDDPDDDKLVLANVDDSIVPVDHVQDYCLRPEVCQGMSLWDWWRRSSKCKSSPKMRTERQKTIVNNAPGLASQSTEEHSMDADDATDDSSARSHTSGPGHPDALQSFQSFGQAHMPKRPTRIQIRVWDHDGSLESLEGGFSSHSNYNIYSHSFLLYLHADTVHRYILYITPCLTVLLYPKP